MDYPDQRIPLTECGDSILRLGTLEFELEKEREPGRGGTCLVYHALQRDGTGLGRRVILKEFYPDCPDSRRWRDRESGLLSLPGQEYIEDRRQRFCRSYEVFKALFNDEELNLYTVQAQGCLSGNGTAYMVVDYGSGMTLGDYMDREPSLFDFLSRIRVLARVLELLHRRGYVHMDLKPENLLCYEDHDVVKLLDTDSLLKKEIFAGKAVEVVLSGSRGYIAPEVLALNNGLEEDWLGCLDERLAFAELGHRADLFSLGVILRRFFRRNCPEDASLETCLRRREPDLSGKAVRMAERLLEKTLAVRPEDRYETMAQAARALEELLPLLDPGKPRLADRFSENPFPVQHREKELARMETLIKAQAARGSRILCICGIGGVGKSVLARHYARCHSEEYDVITEVSVASAADAVERLTILNWEPDPNLSDDRYRESCKKMLIRLCREQKTLILVHDYDVSGDPDFDIWKELGCDVILTSRQDWSGSGIATLHLRCSDLSTEQAEAIFTQAYLQNCETREQHRRLSDLLMQQEKMLKELVHHVDGHPLTLSLLARYMTGVPGQELGPQQALKELTGKIFAEGSPREFQNRRDDQVREDNVFGHLAGLFQHTLASSRFRGEEMETLRQMLMVPSGYGISPARFTQWSGLEEDWLVRLCRKGWLEYLPRQQDVLMEEARPGVFILPRALQQVLSRELEQSILPSTAAACSNRLYDMFTQARKFPQRQAILAHMEQLLMLPEEISEDYLLQLSQLASAYAVLIRVDRLLDVIERFLRIYRQLPPAEQKKENLKQAVSKYKRFYMTFQGGWDDPRELLSEKETFESLIEADVEILYRFELGMVNEAMALIKKLRGLDESRVSLAEKAHCLMTLTQIACRTGSYSQGKKYYDAVSQLYRTDAYQAESGTLDSYFFETTCVYATALLADGCSEDTFRLLDQLYDAAVYKLGTENMVVCKLESLLADACIIREDPAAAAAHRERAAAGELTTLDKAAVMMSLALDYRKREPEKAREACRKAMALYNDILREVYVSWQLEGPEELAEFYYANAVNMAEVGKIILGMEILETWLRLVWRLYGRSPLTAAHFAAVSKLYRQLGLTGKAGKCFRWAEHCAPPRMLAMGQLRPNSRWLAHWIDETIGEPYGKLMELAEQHKFQSPIR